MIEPENNKSIPMEEKATRSRVLRSQCFDEKRYEFDFSFKPANPDHHMETHTTVEMLRCLERNPKIELESKVLALSPQGLTYKKLNAKSFRESFVNNDKKHFKFKEGFDTFAIADGNPGSGMGGGLVGQDFTPLLGGPFYKNLYFYTDYIRMISECFFAYHNDPIAKAFVSMTRDFVLGTGFEVQCDTSTQEGKVALALYKSFEEVNDFQQMIDDVVTESSVYGETMLWWLPHNQAKIVYQLGPNNTIPMGIIPRVRLIDPSNIVEIVTYPEDITRKLFYVWLAPTQYQTYTSGMGSVQTGSEPIQPTLKFIYQQIPAQEIMHYRLNAVSNEKRGRSDLFPILSYLKRFRDGLNYSLIADQKASAWSIDTTIDGAQTDIDAYVIAQAALGTIADAGSEFVHSKAIERQYLGNSSAGNKMSDSMHYCLSAACAGVQIPFNYLGTHLSGGSTRASAIVATEPVAKKMEKRRDWAKRIITDVWKRLMKEAGLPNVQCQIIFPEIITQDRSQKLQDLLLGQQAKWWSSQKAAEAAAKEIGIQDYDYNAEQDQIKKQSLASPSPSPLTDPGQITGTPPLPALPKLGQAEEEPGNSSAVTSDDRKDIKQNGTQL
jgi:hypothetical protein